MAASKEDFNTQAHSASETPQAPVAPLSYENLCRRIVDALREREDFIEADARLRPLAMALFQTRWAAYMEVAELHPEVIARFRRDVGIDTKDGHQVNQREYLRRSYFRDIDTIQLIVDSSTVTRAKPRVPKAA